MDNVCNKSKCCKLWIFCVLQSGLGISIATTRHQVDVQDQPLIQELHSPVKGEFPENKLLILTRSIEILNNCTEVKSVLCLVWIDRPWLSLYVKLVQAFKRCINQCNTFLEWWLILKFNSSENLPWIDDGKEVIQSTCHISSQSTTTYFEPPARPPPQKRWVMVWKLIR